MSPSDEVPVSYGTSPITTSTAAPARKPVTTALERNCAIQPSLEGGEEQEQHSGDERDRGDELCRVGAAEAGHETAPPATAASEELGPVEICRDVQKSA